MTEDSLRLLASSEIINDNLNNIIDSFVLFYGEDRREEIETRLKNTLIIKFNSPFILAENINTIKKSVFKEVFNIPSEKNIYFNITILMDFLTKQNPETYRYIPNEVKEIIFGSKEDSATDVIQNLNNGNYHKINEFLKKYEEVKLIIEPYEKIIENEHLKTSHIRKKYYKILLDEFKYLIPQKELDNYEKYELFTPIINSYFGTSIMDDGHCFDEEHESILNNPNTPQYKIDNIILDRISFLNRHGFSYEQYDDCLKDPKCKDFIEKAIKDCTAISKRKKELYREQAIEIVESLEDYKQCRQLFEKKDYLNKNYLLGPFVYENLGISCCETNYIYENQMFIESPIALINVNTPNPDCTIIHELNHAFELYTIDVNDKECKVIYGWDDESFQFKKEQEYEQIKYTGITRKYELLNEYVNDRIAEEITEIMHNQGNYIFSKYQRNDTSNYSIMKFLLEDFYSEFKDIIIVSRTNGNINYLYETIGKQNFEALNELTNQFYQEFGFGISSQIALVDYYKNVDNEKTNSIKNYIAKKNTIMENMRENIKRNHSR